MAVEISLTKVPLQVDAGLLRESQTIIKNELERAGYNGRWLSRPIERITVRAACKFRASRAAYGKLFVKVKPGDNGTAWEWELTPPAPTNPEFVLRDLQQRAAVVADVVGPAAAPAKPSPAPDTSRTSAETEAGVFGLGEKIASLERAAAAMVTRRHEIARLNEAAEELMAEAARLEAEAKNDRDGEAAYKTLQTLRSLMGG